MELLVATLAHTKSGREVDVQARIRLIADTVRHAQGLVASRFYRGRRNDSYYLILTTWEDDEGWRRAQERYNPKHLLLESATEMLAAVPEQWFMRYLWGYSRPAAVQTIAAAQLASIRHEQLDAVQRGWIQTLRQMPALPLLASAFLARGTNEKSASGEHPALGSSGVEPAYHQGSVFLNLFSWASEIDREDFSADTDFRTLNKFVNSAGVAHMLPLEPL